MDPDQHEAALRLRALLDGLVGQPCFNALLGAGADYSLVLDLGEPQRRSLRLANPRLSFLQRTYEGLAGLLVECPWRVEGPGGVAAACFEPRGPNEVGQQAIAELVERTVTAAAAEGPGFDLVLTLDDGWVLRAFAVQPGDNWSVWGPTGAVLVGPRSRLTPSPPPTPGGGGGPDLRPADQEEAALARWRARLEARRGGKPSND
ncbi:MAG: hypothetical protein H6730_26460 [Deltaproteobacteria bacterium]|nr:hypothetical protein [Deltaproteobacteria bacterium]